MAAISFVTELTADGSWLTRDHQSCCSVYIFLGHAVYLYEYFWEQLTRPDVCLIICIYLQEASNTYKVIFIQRD